MRWLRRFVRRHSVVLAILASGAAAWAIWVIQTAEHESGEAVAFTSLPADENDVRIDAWTDTGRVVSGHRIQLTISVQNTTATTLRSLQFIRFDPGAFTPDGGKCWRGNMPVCVAHGTSQARPTGFPPELPSGDIVTLDAPLVASSKSGKFDIDAVIGWSDGTTFRQKFIHLAPLVIESRLQAVAKVTREFLKDFALLLLLAFLGYYLKRAEDVRSELQQTNNVLLPITHQRMEQHWLPLSSAIWGFVTYTNAYINTRSEENRELAVFYLLVFWRHMRDIVESVGGFHVKDQKAESVLSDGWLIVFLWSTDVFTRTGYERALEQFADRHMSYLRYREVYAGRRAFRAVAQAFDDEIRNCRSRILVVKAVAEIVSSVLDFEVNGPYAPWYGSLEPFDDEEFDRIRSYFRTALNVLGNWRTKELVKLDRLLDEYAEHARQRR